MKKRIAMLLALVMVFGLTACGSRSEAPGQTNAPEAAPAEAGRVCYLNFNPEFDGALQELAAAYTAETGVAVKVLTAASGTYADTLTAEMAQSEAPTIFNIGNMDALAHWDDYAIDLAGTALADELIQDDFNLYNDAGELKAMGYCYESFGIIVNTDLLEQAGYTLSDIRDFASLKAIADDIHTNAAALGFDAFCAAGLDSSSAWRFSGQLANLPLYYEGIVDAAPSITGAYLDSFRNIWDLYITDSAADAGTLSTFTSDACKAQFLQGQAVFYQNGSSEYASLIEAGFTDDQLAMIPIYCGAEGEENNGLCSGTENCWAVSSQVSEADQNASLDFLLWLVTDPDASAVLVHQLGAVPFTAAPPSSNKFILDGNALRDEGKTTIPWVFQYTPNANAWRATVVTALAAYSADPTDANWAQVAGSFVDGWAYEYTLANG